MTNRLAMGVLGMVTVTWATPALGQTPTDAPGPPVTPTVAAPATSAGARTTGPAAAPTTPPPAAPVVVALLPVRGAWTPLAEGARDALVQLLTSRLIRRPVQALSDAGQLSTMARCRVPACVGAEVARAGAISAVLMRWSAAGRGARIRLEVVDPVSGVRRGERVTIEVADNAEPAAALAAAAAPLLALMPAAPPLTTLLVAVNVDGADVTIDDRPAGLSPIAPVEITPGQHIVQSSRRGFLVVRRSVEIARGEAGRINMDLERDPNVLEFDDTEETEAMASAEVPLYLRWYVLAGAGAALVAIVATVAIVASSGGDDSPVGYPVPPIQ